MPFGFVAGRRASDQPGMQPSTPEGVIPSSETPRNSLNAVLLCPSLTTLTLPVMKGTGLAPWFATTLTVGLAATAPTSPANPEPHRPTWPPTLLSPRPEPTQALRYGPAQAQGIDIFLPAGAGPFPVAILIHGGCWSDLPGAGREQLRHLGADLAANGIAAWSLGYRRADEPGGGYPGTFNDVAEASTSSVARRTA